MKCDHKIILNSLDEENKTVCAFCRKFIPKEKIDNTKIVIDVWNISSNLERISDGIYRLANIAKNENIPVIKYIALNKSYIYMGLVYLKETITKF